MKAKLGAVRIQVVIRVANQNYNTLLSVIGTAIMEVER